MSGAGQAASGGDAAAACRANASAAPSAAEMGVRPRDVDQLCVDTVRMLAVDMTNAANSGHPGMPMGMADAAFVLWTRHLRYDAADPAWRDRDRFVLSGGHGSALIYAMLHLSGYDLPMAELRRFRQFGSRTPGHPERGVTAGVEVTTGPLGQGIANAVGIAVAERMTAARFNGDGHTVSSHRVFCFCGDGDLMEGISAEAASMAGHWGLGNLKVVYDANRISIDGSTDLSFTEDVTRRFEGHGWRVLSCDGHDRADIARALDAAVAETSRPVMVVCRTIIGKGSPNRQNTEKAHGAPLGADETKLTKDGYGWPTEKPFTVPAEVYERFAARAAENAVVRAAWDAGIERFRAAKPDVADIWERGWSQAVPSADVLLERMTRGFAPVAKATRQHSQDALQRAAAEVPTLVGGSADLTHSNLTWIAGSPAIGPTKGGPAETSQFAGRNFYFGVREHAMGAVMNGIAAHGFFAPYGATFLAFLDYMRAPVRLASLSHHGSIFVYSHDSIGLGEDGPTHQPVEHLWTARMIPGVVVHRPADALETFAAWADAAARRDRPTVIVTTRQKLPELARPAGFKPADVLRGGYIVHEPEGGPQAVVIATGSEVGAAVDAAKALGAQGLRCRVVSMPSVELFDRQDAAWKDSVLPKGVRRVAVEAGRPDGWGRFVGLDGLAIGISSFGASAPADQLFDHFGLTAPKIAAAIGRWWRG
ncbi:MAG: Transketolase [Planctomycetes bacterium]|nr:Transketolase [Planctomycetota bacterium]